MRDDSAADLAAFGAPPEVVEAAKADPESESFGIWEENAETMMMFLRLQTQWHVINGAFIGLNYQSVDFLFRIHNTEKQSAVMEDLQAMELAALQVLNKRKD